MCKASVLLWTSPLKLFNSILNHRLLYFKLPSLLGDDRTVLERDTVQNWLQMFSYGNAKGCQVILVYSQDTYQWLVSPSVSDKKMNDLVFTYCSQPRIPVI